MIFNASSIAVIGLSTILLTAVKIGCQNKDLKSGVNWNDSADRFDKNNPTADFNGAASLRPAEIEQRKRRETKYIEHSHQIDEADEWSLNTLVSHMQPPSGFPIPQSDLIVVGRVRDARAVISSDKTAGYSEFVVTVSNVLFSPKKVVLTGSEIVIERMGGNVRFPSGRVVTRGIGHQPLPRKDKTYVLFLKWDERGEDYLIVTGYEIYAETIRPLDGTPDPLFEEYNRFRLVTKDAFCKQLKVAISKAVREKKVI